MILKKVIVESRVSLGNYQVKDEEGNLLKASILPRKLLQNYIKIDDGRIIYLILETEDSLEGKFATKYDFEDDQDLWEEKLKLNSEEKIRDLFGS